MRVHVTTQSDAPLGPSYSEDTKTTAIDEQIINATLRPNVLAELPTGFKAVIMGTAEEVLDACTVPRAVTG
jgi:hypothetical protein